MYAIAKLQTQAHREIREAELRGGVTEDGVGQQRELEPRAEASTSDARHDERLERSETTRSTVERRQQELAIGAWFLQVAGRT